MSKLGVANKADLESVEVVRSKLELSLNCMPNLLPQEKLISWLQSGGKIPLAPHFKSDDTLATLIE